MKKLIRYFKARREYRKRRGYMQIQVYPDQLPWYFRKRKEHKEESTAYVMFWITPTHEEHGGRFIIDLSCKVLTPMMADVKWSYLLPKSYVKNCLREVFVDAWRTVYKRFDSGEGYFLCFKD